MLTHGTTPLPHRFSEDHSSIAQDASRPLGRKVVVSCVGNAPFAAHAWIVQKCAGFAMTSAYAVEVRL